MPTKTEEKNDKSEKHEKQDDKRERNNEERERHAAIERRQSAMARQTGLSDEERECKDREAEEERKRWAKPPEPEFSKENLALLEKFAKKAIEIRKLLADRQGISLPLSARFVGGLAGVVNMARGLGIEALEEVIEPIPREGHIAHSTDPPMSLAYAPPGVNPTPWVPQEPLDRLGLGPDARLLTSETVEPADGGGTPPPTQQDPQVSISPTSAPQGSGGVVLNVTGTATNFVAGQTQVSISGSGVNHGTVKVNSATSLDVPVTVFNEAATGDRTITVTTGSETASATFSVTTP
jgi:hypothetical protein